MLLVRTVVPSAAFVRTPAALMIGVEKWTALLGSFQRSRCQHAWKKRLEVQVIDGQIVNAVDRLEKFHSINSSCRHGLASLKASSNSTSGRDSDPVRIKMSVPEAAFSPGVTATWFCTS